jgi:hypothetical protein
MTTFVNVTTEWWKSADSNSRELTESWVRESLAQGAVMLKFTKADGSLREMIATTCIELLPAPVVVESTKPPRTLSQEVCHVWDTQAKAWRSFRWDRLLSTAEAPSVTR